MGKTTSICPCLLDSVLTRSEHVPVRFRTGAPIPESLNWQSTRPLTVRGNPLKVRVLPPELTLYQGGYLIIGVVGSRKYPNLQGVRNYIASLPLDTIIVSGGAPGVDRTAVTEANRLGLKTIVYAADWNRYGKQAGFLRNTTIVEASEKLVAFWDGESHGTLDSITKAVKAGKMVEIYGPG